MNIQEKIEQIEASLQIVVDQHNQLTEQRNRLVQQFSELQGSLKTLKELKEEESDVDPPSTS